MTTIPVHSRPPVRPLVEWPTLGMVVLCYAGLWAVLALSGSLGALLSVPLLAVVIALHSSLQHEVLHGHPFRSQLLSEALIFPAVGLFIPYLRFKDTHLKHHYDPDLTDPYDDPESNYLDPAVWARLPRVLRALYRVNNTLMGRMLVGPAISIWSFYADDLAAIARGDARIRRAYVLHALGILPVLAIVNLSALPVWAYVLSAYLGFSLLKIRTYLEHRAHEKVPGRTVIIEDRGPLSWLFLNNNFHSVHHSHPTVPWYRLPTIFAERRAQFLERNRSYFYRSYGEIFRQYFLSAKDPVPHPLMSDTPALEVMETVDALEALDHSPRGVANSQRPKSV